MKLLIFCPAIYTAVICFPTETLGVKNLFTNAIFTLTKFMLIEIIFENEAWLFIIYIPS